MLFRDLTAHERKSGLNLFAALECFREIRHTMPLQYVVTFLLVALDEGRTVGEYAIKSRVSASVMSRHISDLGPRTRGLAPGLSILVTKQNINNMREHTVHLTEKGRALYQKVVDELNR
jgi:DNA-binding MarR family transcriptional regulator